MGAIMKKEKIVLIFIVLVTSICVILSFLYKILKSDEITKKRILSMDRHTKVLQIYNDSFNHNFTTVLYATGERKTLYFDLKVGDSISKNKNDSIMYIFRNDSILQINLLPYGYKAN